MTTFPLVNQSSSTQTNTSIKRPREITRFSFDDQHICRPLSDQSLRYYYPPFIDSPGAEHVENVDLSQGFESFRKFDAANDLHLDALLETLAKHEQQQTSRVEADFVTWRGMMTKA